MPNAFIELIDSGGPINPATVLESLSRVPFVQHQFKWCCQTFANIKDPDEFQKKICGYTGVKKVTPPRAMALRGVQATLNDLADKSPQVLRALPERAGRGTPDFPDYHHPAPPLPLPTAGPGVGSGPQQTI